MPNVDLKELNQYSPYYVDAKITGSTLNNYEQFTNKVYNLPENIKTFFLNSLKIAEFIKDTMVKNNLTEESGKELARIIRDLLFADFYLGDVVNQIGQRVGVDDQKAKIIAGLIIIELFSPILEDLKKIHTQKFASATKEQEVKDEPSPQPPIQPPVEDESIIDLRSIL